MTIIFVPIRPNKSTVKVEELEESAEIEELEESEETD